MCLDLFLYVFVVFLIEINLKWFKIMIYIMLNVFLVNWFYKKIDIYFWLIYKILLNNNYMYIVI